MTAAFNMTPFRAELVERARVAGGLARSSLRMFEIREASRLVDAGMLSYDARAGAFRIAEGEGR